MEENLKKAKAEERIEKEKVEQIAKERENQKLWIVDLQMKLSEALKKEEKSSQNMKDHHENVSNLYGNQ